VSGDVVVTGAVAGPTAAEWDALADRSGADPFVRPGWIDAWRAAFGGGSLEQLVVRRDGQLVGVLPMVVRLGVWRSPTNEHSPAFAPVAQDAAALDALAEALLERAATALSLGFLDAGSAEFDALRRAAESAGYATHVRPIHRSPVLVIGEEADWEASLSRGMLADLRRRRRRLTERGRLTVASAREPSALAELLALERRSWKGDRGTAIASEARVRGFYDAVAAWAAARGSLRVAVLRLDDQPLAALLALEEAGALHLLKAGYDPDFARWSPGQLLLQEVLRRAFADGLRRVELHGADEPYKRAWTSEVRPRVALEAFAPTPAGRLAHAAAVHGRPFARRARRLRHPTPRRITS
jgi:CelD/BcsL family acetyltransferase involved in cellulose biosynthesis